MEFSRRDFLRNTAAIAAVAERAGNWQHRFADNGDEELRLPVVNVAAQSRDEAGQRFRAGRSGSLEYCAFNPKRYQLGAWVSCPWWCSCTARTARALTATQLLANDGATLLYVGRQLKEPHLRHRSPVPGQ